MSRSQMNIVSRLLLLASKSSGGKNWQMHASGIACGNKLICTAVNNNRSKFGKNIFVCGHSEANCIWNYCKYAFPSKKNPSLVLGGLRGKTKS